MGQFKVSILDGFQSLSLSLKKVASLQFFRHPPVRSVDLGIFSHLSLQKKGELFLPLLKGGEEGFKLICSGGHQ